MNRIFQLRGSIVSNDRRTWCDILGIFLLQIFKRGLHFDIFKVLENEFASVDACVGKQQFVYESDRRRGPLNIEEKRARDYVGPGNGKLLTFSTGK